MKKQDIDLVAGFLEERFYDFAEWLEDMHLIDGNEAGVLIEELKQIDVVAYPRYDPQPAQINTDSEPHARKAGPAGPEFTGFMGE